MREEINSVGDLLFLFSYDKGSSTFYPGEKISNSVWILILEVFEEKIIK